MVKLKPKLFHKMTVKCEKCSHIMTTYSKQATITCSKCNFEIPKIPYFDIHFENPENLPILFRLNNSSPFKGDIGLVNEENYLYLKAREKKSRCIFLTHHTGKDLDDFEDHDIDRCDSFSHIQIGLYDRFSYEMIQNFVLGDYLPLI